MLSSSGSQNLTLALTLLLAGEVGQLRVAEFIRLAQSLTSLFGSLNLTLACGLLLIGELGEMGESGAMLS